MKAITVLSLEQALSLPSGTARFVHQGFRVIRIEPAARGAKRPGDPNRYVGPQVDLPDRRAYFLGPNAGKEAIALDLRSADGRELLLELISKLSVDVFAVNTLPRRYDELGISYERLAAARPELIWVGLSAFGPDHPSVPGYDPALQAELGYMDMTGEADGPPLLCGVPMVDLKAGDEVFAQVCLALAERAESGRGKRIDISMAQAATSWMMTVIPLLDLGGTDLPVGRRGNEHREFVPVNLYPCKDGHLYLAIGNDVQWQRLCALEAFASLASPARESNAQRVEHRRAINAEITEITATFSVAELLPLLRDAGLVVAPAQPLSAVVRHPAAHPHFLATHLENGRTVKLAPPALDTPYLDALHRTLEPPPAYGQHTRAILSEVGLDPTAIDTLFQQGVVS